MIKIALPNCYIPGLPRYLLSTDIWPCMGPPVSATVALEMEDVEEQGLPSYPTPPPFWKRYVEDTCTSLPTAKSQPSLLY